MHVIKYHSCKQTNEFNEVSLYRAPTIYHWYLFTDGHMIDEASPLGFLKHTDTGQKILPKSLILKINHELRSIEVN